MARKHPFSPARLSVRGKLTLFFVLIIVVIMAITIALHVRTTAAIRASIYHEMLSNVAYYQQNLDSQIHNIAQLQIEFFQDRKLPFLAGKDSLLSEYERREANLSVQERLRTVTGISDLVESGVLYFPKTGYRITEAQISAMSPQDAEALQAYLSYGDSSLHFREGRFFIARTGEVRSTFSGNPNYLLVITFSSDEIIRQLSMLAGAYEGGAFLYDPRSSALLESPSGADSQAILQALQTGEDGGCPATQRLRVGSRTFLTLVQPMDTGAILVQYTPEDAVTSWIRQSWIITGLFLGGMLVLAMFFFIHVQRVVHRPLATLSDAFARVEGGQLTEHIHHDGTDEFSYIYERFNAMEDRLAQMINEVYVQKNLAQRAQLKQLQAQINPHFLYNSFFILSRRIRREDIDGAVELAQHLGDYFKYLSRDQSDDIPLSDEVAHARSYAAIQGTRFASRMRIDFGALPDGWRERRVPRLILQPLMENAFKYGLENVSEEGLLRVSFAQGEDGSLRIAVEDNGESQADPAAMQRALEEADPDVVSGLSNIHRRLRIYFQGRGGLRIARSALGGISVTIVLPGDMEVSNEPQPADC